MVENKTEKYIIQIFLFSLIVLTTSTSPLSLRSQDDCDPNIPSRPVPLPQDFFADVDGIKSNVCGKGEYLDWFECKPCEDGTFMTRRMAEEWNHSHCQECYETTMYEIVVEPCTKTRDATIMCEDGYFRRDVPGKPCQSECRRCDVCGVASNMFKNFEVQECQDYKNAICCSSHDMLVVNGECILQTITILTTTTTKKREVTNLPYLGHRVITLQSNASRLNYIFTNNGALFFIVLLTNYLLNNLCGVTQITLIDLYNVLGL